MPAKVRLAAVRMICVAVLLAVLIVLGDHQKFHGTHDAALLCFGIMVGLVVDMSLDLLAGD